MARKKKATQVDTSKEDKVRVYLLDRLGTPPALVKIDVFKLHDDSHFRANIYVLTKGEVRIAHSFYVVANADGFTASPPLTKRYHTDSEIEELLQSSRKAAA
jgi:hypothetical protein